MTRSRPSLCPHAISMRGAIEGLSRTTLVALVTVVTALLGLLAQSPFWLDAVPWVFKLVVVSLVVLSFFRPHDGLLVVAGLSALGLTAGRFIDSPARGSEALVLGFLVGWLLGWTRDRRRWSGGSLNLPVLLFSLVILASLVEQLWFLQIQTDFPKPFLQGLWRYVSRDYLGRPMMGFGMVRTAALLIEGLGLCVAVVALSRTNNTFVQKLIRMTLAGAMGAAALNVIYALMEVIRSGDWSTELVSMFLYRRWTAHVGDVNAAGSYFAMVLPLVIGAASVTRGRHRMLLAAGGALIGLALWMTGARAAQAGLLVVMVLVIASRIASARSPRERSFMIAATAIVAVAAVVMTFWLSGGPGQIPSGATGGVTRLTPDSLTASIQNRLLFTQGSLTMWASHPVFGVGVGQYSLWSARYSPAALLEQSPNENAHNYVLQVAAELGVVGLVLFLWVLGVAARPLGRAVLHKSADPLRLSLAVGLGAFILSALAGHPFLVPPVIYPFWVLVGIASTCTGFERTPTSGTLPVSSHAHVWVLGLTAVLVMSMSIRVARKVDLVDLTKVTYGLHQWETELDGTPFRWTSGRARLFVPATATDIELPFRAILVGDNRDPMTVEISIDARWSPPVHLLDEEWRVHRLRLPSIQAGAKHRTVDLRVERPWRPSRAIPGSTDPRELGVKLGEVEGVLGLTREP